MAYMAKVTFFDPIWGDYHANIVMLCHTTDHDFVAPNSADIIDTSVWEVPGKYRTYILGPPTLNPDIDAVSKKLPDFDWKNITVDELQKLGFTKRAVVPST